MTPLLHPEHLYKSLALPNCIQQLQGQTGVLAGLPAAKQIAAAVKATLAVTPFSSTSSPSVATAWAAIQCLPHACSDRQEVCKPAMHPVQVSYMCRPACSDLSLAVSVDAVCTMPV